MTQKNLMIQNGCVKVSALTLMVKLNNLSLKLKHGVWGYVVNS